MKNKLTMIVAVLMVVGLVVGGSAAYGAVANKGPRKDPFKSLNLSSDQTKRIEAQREASRATNKASGELLKAKTEALHEQIAKPGVTKSDVSGLVSEVNAIQAQIFSQRIDGLFAVKEILTPAQYQQLQELKKSGAKNRGPRGKKQPNW